MRKLFDTISRNLSGRMVGHAINLMRPWCDACGKTDDLLVLQRAYQQVVETYFTHGSRPEQQQMVHRLIRDLYGLLDVVYLQMRLSESTQYEYRTMLQPVAEPTSPETAFDYFWLLRPTIGTDWAEQAYQVYLSYLSDPEMEDEAMMAVSGLTLSLLRSFSEKNLQHLLYAAEEQYATCIRERAWVGLIIVMMCYDVRMSYYPLLLEQLQDLVLTDDGRVLARSAMTSLIHTQAVEWVTQVFRQQQQSMQAALMGYLKNHRPESSQMLIEIQEDDLQDVDVAELQRAAMAHQSEMAQMKHYALDINYPLLSAAYHTHFFSLPCRYFLPYAADYMADVSAELADKVDQLPLPTLCDSDKYAVVHAMRDMLDMLPKELDESIKTDDAAQILCNGYTQQLYRFFTLNPWGIDNPLNQIPQLKDKQIFQFLNPTANDKAISAHDYYVSRSYQVASQLYESLMPNIEVTKQHELALCYQRMGNYDAAIQVYNQLESTDWTLRQLCYCYGQLGKYEEQLLTLDTLLATNPDDINYLVRKAKCLIRLELPFEAEQLLCRIELIRPGMETVQRNLVWAAFLCEDYDKAIEYTDLLLDNQQATMRFQDALNAGHLYFCLHEPAKALEYYVLAARYAESLPVFLAAFRPDRRYLVERGVSKQEIYMMEDQVISMYNV